MIPPETFFIKLTVKANDRQNLCLK